MCPAPKLPIRAASEGSNLAFRPSNEAPELMFRSEAAAYLRRSEETLKYWAHRHTGPPCARIGARVMYRKADLDRFLDEQFAAWGAERESA